MQSEETSTPRPALAAACQNSNETPSKDLNQLYGELVKDARLTFASATDDPPLWYGCKVSPDDIEADVDGRAMVEILQVVKILADARIPCCLVDVAALRYYGAPRGGSDWPICVPTDQFISAISLFKSDEYSHRYTQVSDTRYGLLGALNHIWPRFKLDGLVFFFRLFPSQDCHFECIPAKLERSKLGVPYPRLEVLAQGLLESFDELALTDLVDGMDLTAEWGYQHLDLSGTVDYEYIKWKNTLIEASGRDFSCVSQQRMTLKELWEAIVAGKEQRMLGPKYPKDVFATRYRCIGSPDPRSFNRDYV